MTDLLKNPISFHDIEYEFATPGVYAIYCKHTDTYYIGQGGVVLRRLVEHFSNLREGVHPNHLMQQEYNEWGEDQFVMALIADMPRALQPDLLRRESEEIQRFKAHGQKLYNNVSLTIKLSPPIPDPAERVARERDGTAGRAREAYLSHAERVAPVNSRPATCYDCGFVGLSQVDVFLCDDGFNRCQSCIELYLDKWKFIETTPRTRKPERALPKRGSYHRWLAPKDASIQEHILLAADSFAKKHGYIPTRVFVHPGLDAPDCYRDIEIVKGGIAVGRYIDIPIE